MAFPGFTILHLDHSIRLTFNFTRKQSSCHVICVDQSAERSPVAPAHHVDAISVRGRGLPGQVPVHGAPAGVGQVVVPAVIALSLVFAHHLLLTIHHHRGQAQEGDQQRGHHVTLCHSGVSLCKEGLH